MACYDCALQYSQFRKQFHDLPIAAHQLVQEKLVWMITEITKAQLLAYHMGRRKDAGTLEYTQVSLAKRNNVRAALNIARAARGILGAYGITLEYHAMRHAANLETVDTYVGTYDLHTLILGRDITGFDAFGAPPGGGGAAGGPAPDGSTYSSGRRGGRRGRHPRRHPLRERPDSTRHRRLHGAAVHRRRECGSGSHGRLRAGRRCSSGCICGG